MSDDLAVLLTRTSRELSAATNRALQAHRTELATDLHLRALKCEAWAKQVDSDGVSQDTACELRNTCVDWLNDCTEV